jgi:hypothetical protein
MQILFETTYLAPGQAQSAADITLNGEQVVDEAEFFRAASITLFPRGNQRTDFDFSVSYVYPTSVSAEMALLLFPSNVPMTSADNGVLQCLCGAETPATSQICYMSGAVLRKISVRQVGVSLIVRYSFTGPGFTSQVPSQGLPTFPNANEINQVLRRGNPSISLGATSMAVAFSSQMPGIPGSIVVSVSGPTGSGIMFAQLDSDSITTNGFNVAFNVAAPDANHVLNYIAQM